MSAHPVLIASFEAALVLVLVILSLIGYFAGVRPLGRERRCTGLARGRVVRYAFVRRAGIPLPVVEYEVGGEARRIIGPTFSSVVSTTTSAPFASTIALIETNLKPGRLLPRRLRIRVRENSMLSIAPSPLAELDPVGAQARVFYNPERPQEAFVERHARAERLVLGVIGASMTGIVVLLILLALL